MNRNDRVIRVLLGICIGLLEIEYVVAPVLLVLGVLLIMSGMIGFSMIYKILGVNRSLHD